MIVNLLYSINNRNRSREENMQAQIYIFWAIEESPLLEMIKDAHELIKASFLQT
jgi:hypothetical protein